MSLFYACLIGYVLSFMIMFRLSWRLLLKEHPPMDAGWAMICTIVAAIGPASLAMYLLAHAALWFGRKFLGDKP